MAYNNRFVVTIINDGQILKELANGSVPIEFGSEYKIRLRNKHNRRAVCKLYIDGENVSGGGFVIPANSYVDIERPVDVARKFKFVSLDSEEAHDFGKNGSNPDKIKGTIVAEFSLERESIYPSYPIRGYPDPYDQYHRPWIKYGAPCGAQNSSNLKSKSIGHDTLGQLNNLVCATNLDMKLQDGATVEGAKSTQKFDSTYFNSEDNWTTIRLFLQGFDPQKYVLESSAKVHVTETQKDTSFEKDAELIALEQELLELQKMKARREIEKLKAELC